MAEEEAAAPEEEDEELVDESMDEEEGALPSLGKRRSTDTASSAQTAPKRARPGSLAEVTPCFPTCAVALRLSITQHGVQQALLTSPLTTLVT